jgi:hypothetical protein
MNWDAIGALGEVLGSIAVFLTLGYLAIAGASTRGDQVRHSISQNSTGRQSAICSCAARRTRGLIGLNVRVNEAVGGQPSVFEATLVEEVGLTAEEAAAMHWDRWLVAATAADHSVPRTALERRAGRFRLRGASHLRGHAGQPGSGTNATRATLRPDAVRYVDTLLAQ